MFKRVLRRLSGAQQDDSIDSGSSDESPDQSWHPPNPSTRILAFARTTSAQPDPPSHTETPPPEPESLMPPAPPQHMEDDRSRQLAMLLAAADDDEDADGIAEQFSTPEGRALLVNGSPVESSAVDERRVSQRIRRSRARRSEIADLIPSDDEEMPVIMESIRMNPHLTDGVTTRRGTVVGRDKKISTSKSVPLTDKKKQKENFIERNRRRARIDRAIHLSRNPKEDRRINNPSSSRAHLRRSSRLQRNADLEDNASDEDSDGSSIPSDCSVRSTGSAGADDERDSEADSEMDEAAPDSDDEKTGDSTFKANANMAEDSDEEEDYVIKRKRTKGSSSRSSAAGANRRSSGRLRDKRKAVQSPSKDFLGRRRKQKRRRTDPNSVFESPENFITAAERRERLEALVKQTADIAKDLNAAMMAEKERDQAAATALAAGSPARVAKKVAKPTSEGELFWPTGPGLVMQPHQVDGVRWLLTLDSQGLNAILADEMGLGKTIQSVTFLATILTVENRGPHLVIAPKNVVPHWASEFERWYPGKFKVVTHIGAGEERFDRMTEVFRTMPDFDVVVTSFELAMRDFFTKPRPESAIAWQNRHVLRSMQKLEFEYAVVDEAHRLKNAEAKFTAGLRKFTQARRRLLLTGTPLSNNLQELWALMNVLNPRIFGSQGTFDAWFAAPFDTSEKRNSLSISEQSIIVDRLHTVLRPFFRRRLRADVCPSFSSADETLIKCPQSALQKALNAHYTRTGKKRELTVNNIVMQLRKVANHPFTVSRALFELSAVETPRSLVGASGKFLFLYHALPRLISAGHRVLIFSQFRLVLDFIEDLLDLLKFKYGRLDGMTTNDDRENTVAKFNTPGCDMPVFLLTTRAGGVGLNLQSADTVILYDSDWNPSADLQAVSRIQRIGQKRTVHIMRLVTDNSIDEVIVDRGREKLRTEAVAVGAGKFNTNVDPAADSVMRQRDLEQLLAEYEARQNKRNSPDVIPIQGRADASAPVTSDVVKDCFERWEPLLLRNGESSLPAFEGSVQPLIESPEEVPEWLRPGCDARCAGLALKCQHPSQVPAALEKGRRENAQKTGALPTKRERRARFNFKGIYDGLSADDESEFEGADVTAESSESESEVEFVPDSLVKVKKPSARPVLPKTDSLFVPRPALQPYNYQKPNGQIAARDENAFAHIASQMGTKNDYVQTNGQGALVTGGTFNSVSAHMGAPFMRPIMANPAVSPARPIASRAIASSASKIDLSGPTARPVIPGPTFVPVAPRPVGPPAPSRVPVSASPGIIAQNGARLGCPPISPPKNSAPSFRTPIIQLSNNGNNFGRRVFTPQRNGASSSEIPVIEISDSDDDKTFHEIAVARAEARARAKVRMREKTKTESKAKAKANRTSAKSMAKAAARAILKAKAETDAFRKQQAEKEQKKSARPAHTSRAGVKTIGRSEAQGKKKPQVINPAPTPGTSKGVTSGQVPAQGRTNVAATSASHVRRTESAAIIGSVNVGATDGERGVDPKLITSLQNFTGVLDRGLLAHVLVKCNNDLASAAHEILTYE